MPDVLIVSGYVTIDNAVDAGKLGVFGVMLKPGKPGELLDKIGHLLDLRKDPLISYLRAHFDKVDSREDVAHRFGVSPGTVSNRIRHYTGQFFHEFLHACRLREAQRLLAETELRTAYLLCIINTPFYNTPFYFLSLCLPNSVRVSTCPG